MMLQGSSLGDSPVLDGRQKAAFLPPLNAHRRYTETNDSASGEDSDQAAARNTQCLGTRWRAKPKKPHGRREVNQSSMSDSFVLPRINGSLSQTSTEHRDRKSRTSLCLPSRTRDNRLPVSKSCPALMGGSPRRQLPESEGESPDCEEYEEEDDFGESDSSRDVVPLSCGADLLANGRKRDGKHGDTSNSQDDITEGVVGKLSKLESPRSKANQHGAHRRRNPHHGHHRHSQTEEAGTTLPDIFVRQKTTIHGWRETRQREAKRQSSVERMYEHDGRGPPEVGLASDNSYALDASPWQRSGAGKAAGVSTFPDQVGQQSHLPHHQSRKGSKKKRKEKKKKQRSVDQPDRPHLLRDTTQADIKCMNWLAEGHQGEGAQQVSPSVLRPSAT